MDPTATCRDTAHSVELRLPPIRVHQLAGVEQLCLQREQQGSGPCTLHIGHHLHPNDQDVVTYHGLGIQIRIPTTLTDNEAEQNLLRRIQLQRQRRTGDMWDPAIREDGDPEDAHPLPDVPSEPPGDAVSFMGNGPRPSASSRQRPVGVSSTSTSPETISSTEPHTDWRQTVIFTLEPHRNYLGTIQMVSLNKLPLLLKLSKRDILRVQAVPHRPLDYTQVNLYCILLQRAQEFRPSPYVRLTLIDLELHVNNDVQPTPFRRFPKWMPYVTTREDIFANLGIAQLCVLSMMSFVISGETT